MEKAIVLYEGTENWKRAYILTLAGEFVLVSKAWIDEKYYEIMVFETDRYTRIVDYSPYEDHRIYEAADAEEAFEEVIERWQIETRTLDEIDPEHAVLL